VVENLVKRPKKLQYLFNIYSIKSPGPEGLAWAFKISSQALSHGLSRALAWLGLGFSGPGLAWPRASGQACTSLLSEWRDALRVAWWEVGREKADVIQIPA
jgi:hypothetical protein